MSNTGPFGHQPTSLSTGMGLSDPRLRRALQLGAMTDQKIGFGLKIDSEGRLSVDSAGLANDQTTITNIVQSFANFSSSTTTTISGGGGGGGFDDSLFDDWLANTDLFQQVLRLIAAVGINDPSYGWESGSGANSSLYPNSSILRYIDTSGGPRTAFSAPVTTEEAIFKGGDGGGATPVPNTVYTHTHILPTASSSGSRLNLKWYWSADPLGENMSSQDEVAVQVEIDIKDGNGDTLETHPVHNWGYHDLRSEMGRWFMVGQSTNSSLNDVETSSAFDPSGTGLWIANPAGEAAWAADDAASYTQHNYTDTVYRNHLVTFSVPSTAYSVDVKYIRTYEGQTDGDENFRLKMRDQISVDLAPETSYDPL